MRIRCFFGYTSGLVGLGVANVYTDIGDLKDLDFMNDWCHVFCRIGCSRVGQRVGTTMRMSSFPLCPSTLSSLACQD